MLHKLQAKATQKCKVALVAFLTLTVMLPQNNYRLNINQSSLSKNKIYTSTIVAQRLSVNVQNVLTHSKNPQKVIAH